MRNPAALSMAMVAVVVLLSSGCSTPDPTPVTTAKPTATPIFASDAEALAAAEAAYDAYQTMEDQIVADGGEDPDRIRSLSARDALEAALAGFSEIRDRGLHGTGNSILDGVELAARADTSSTTTNVVTIFGCVDVSATDLLDVDGKSVVNSANSARQAFEMQFDYDPSTKQLLLSSREAESEIPVCD